MLLEDFYFILHFFNFCQAFAVGQIFVLCWVLYFSGVFTYHMVMRVKKWKHQ